jgi:CheY-like chemotaxis protein
VPIIYLVDDDASHLRALSRRLDAAGYHVEAAKAAQVERVEGSVTGEDLPRFIGTSQRTLFLFLPLRKSRIDASSTPPAWTGR